MLIVAKVGPSEASIVGLFPNKLPLFGRSECTFLKYQIMHCKILNFNVISIDIFIFDENQRILAHSLPGIPSIVLLFIIFSSEPLIHSIIVVS